MAASTSTTALVTITNQAGISAFNRGPVTSVFTPPPSCLSTLTFGTDMYFGHRGPGYVGPGCYPSSSTDRGATEWDIYYYSPAQCPSGWSHATSFTSSIGGYGNTVLSLGAATTAILCCPSGYFAATFYDHQCQSVLANPSATLLYVTPGLNGVNQWTGTAASDVSITTVKVPTYNVYGDGIPVWWQSSDLAAFASASLTSSSSVSSSSSTSSSSSPITGPITSAISPTSTETTSPVGTSTSELSTGAKIGIGISVPAASIILGIIALYFFLRGRVNRGPKAAGQHASSQRPSGVAREPSNKDVMSELSSSNPAYDYAQNPYELAAR